MSKNDAGKKEPKAYEKKYSKKTQVIISVICIVLAILFLMWTVAGSVFVFGAETGSASGAGQTGTVKAQYSSGNRMRGVWVSTVASLDYPFTKTTSESVLKAEADEIIDNCYKMGMNAIFLQVQPASDALYKSSYYPWSKYLTGKQGLAPENGFDPLAYWVKQAHAKGIELHAWMNPYRITHGTLTWDELSDDNPAKGAYRDYVVEYNGNYYFDPAEPAVRDLVTNAAVEIVNNYDVDGIHFDDYFYPGTDFNDADSYAKYGNGMNIADWRRDNVDKLIQQVDTAVHNADSHCVFGVSPRGVWENYSSKVPEGSNTRGGGSYSSVYADSRKWVKNNWVDYIAPQIYWEIGYSRADYRTLANWWSDVVSGTNVKLYIGMADYRSNAASGAWKGITAIQNQLNLNESLPQVSGELHFRYKFLVNNSNLFNLYKSRYASYRMPAETDPAGVAPEHAAWLYDVDGHWAETYIWSLVDAGILSGMGDGTFLPDGSVTRAQFVKMLASVSGDDTGSAPSAGFRDVSSSSWYSSYVNWAVARGIASGRGNAQFAPEANITREEMTVMLENYCRVYLPNLKGESEKIVFADADDISSWAVSHVDAVVELGLMSGSASGGRTYFYPKHSTTRAEAARVMYAIREKAAAAK